MSKIGFVSALLLATSLAAQTGALPTDFRGGLVYSTPPPAGVTQYFDLTISNPAGVVITRFDQNWGIATTGTFSVWTTAVGSGSVGNETVASSWTMMSSQSVTVPLGRTSTVLSGPFYLAPGTYGIAMHSANGLSPRYTNPTTAANTGMPVVYSNADMTIDMTAARSRASTAADPFAAGAAGFSPRVANIEIGYTVGQSSADFLADVTGGLSPLTVNFTGVGANIIAWNWDFDGVPATVESTLQNPSFVFACGTHTITLNAVDNLSNVITVTKTNFINTDVTVPQFSHQAIAPGVIQFTDLSAPTPTAWNWDFNGDNVADSAVQNPVFNFGTTCNEVPIRLIVTQACKTFTVTRRIAVNQHISTRFDGPTFTVTGATGGVSFFDLNVTSPQGLTVCALHAHNQAAAGTALTFRVHLTPGTYVGNETTPAPWKLVATENVLAGGGGQQTFIPLSTPLYLPAGIYGVAFEHVGNSPRYNNLGAVTTFSNADVTLTAGATQAEPVFSTGTLFTPRVANVGIYYSTCAFANTAGYGWYGNGCATSLGPVATNTAVNQPQLGNVFQMQVGPAPLGAGFFVLGLDRTVSAFGPLPVDLGVFGGTGCFLRVRPDSTTFLAGVPGGNLTRNLTLPNNPGLLCVQFYTQGLLFDTVNALGAAASDASAAVVGQ